MKTIDRGDSHAVVIVVLVLGLLVGLGIIFWERLSAQISQDASEQASESRRNELRVLAVKQWGVKFGYKSADVLEYRYNEDAPEVISIVSDNLRDKYSGCSDSGAGKIRRGKATDRVEGTQKTFASYQGATQLGDYYYVFVKDQTTCYQATGVEARDAYKEQTLANNFTKTIVSSVSP